MARIIELLESLHRNLEACCEFLMLTKTARWVLHFDLEASLISCIPSTEREQMVSERIKSTEKFAHAAQQCVHDAKTALNNIGFFNKDLVLQKRVADLMTELDHRIPGLPELGEILSKRAIRFDHDFFDFIVKAENNIQNILPLARACAAIASSQMRARTFELIEEGRKQDRQNRGQARNGDSPLNRKTKPRTSINGQRKRKIELAPEPVKCPIKCEDPGTIWIGQKRIITTVARIRGVKKLVAAFPNNILSGERVKYGELRPHTITSDEAKSFKYLRKKHPELEKLISVPGSNNKGAGYRILPQNSHNIL